MNFFQQMFDLMDGIDVTITMKRKNGKLTMSVLPQTASSISPALITGTPDELDEGFFDAIKVPLETAKGLKAELDQYNSTVAAASAKAKEIPEEKPVATKAKPVVKPTVKKSKKPKMIEASLFDQE
jgi:PRTRC genetic system protein E